MKASISGSVMLKDATPDPPLRMMSIAISIAGLPAARAASPKRLPFNVASRGVSNRNESSPPRRRIFSAISLRTRSRVAASSNRAIIGFAPPSCAQAGTSEAVRLDPDAEYGYWSAVTCNPSARALRTISIACLLLPHTSAPSALMCEIFTGIWAWRAMSIVS